MEGKRKILVLCGGKFALGALQKLAYEHYLCGVGIGQGQESVVKTLETAASTSQLPFKHFKDKKSIAELDEWIRSIQPDFIFSISFPFLIPSEVLAYGEKKFLNLHLGPLPAYRGPMPIFEVIRYQEKETAIAVHYINDAFDEGELIFNDFIAINPTDTFGKVATKLSAKAAQVAINLANMLEYATSIPSSAQDENEARYFEFPEEEDTFINWKNMSASEIVSLINACNPWNTGADCLINNSHMKLLSATVSEETHSAIPGTVLSYKDNGKIKIACMDNRCLLVETLSCDWGIVTSEQYVKFLET